MTSIVTFVVLLVLTQFFALLLVNGVDRRWILKVMLVAWISLFLLLLFINYWFPFAGGGDDQGYFYLAATPFKSFKELFDLTKFIGVMEQPGYPWLLSILYQFTGEDIIAYKLLNLALFIMLIPLWYCIGAELSNKHYARTAALCMLLLTPLWYYWMFLLKDIVITVLQSIFLLGSIKISRSKGRSGWIVVLLSTLAITLFRTPLVLLNIAVLVGTIGLLMIQQEKWLKSLLALMMLSVVITTTLLITSNTELMSVIGIENQARVIGSQESKDAITKISESSTMEKSLFPILYLFSESSGLNPQTWFDFDAAGLRGVLALPWIFVVVPFFLLGLIWLFRSGDQSIKRRGIFAVLRSTRLVSTPWGVVLMFILLYLAASWTIGDTTRWRIPDMPAIVSVALAGWMSVSPKIRMKVLMVWMILSSFFSMLFYLVRSL